MEFEQLLKEISQGDQTMLLVVQVFVVVFAALMLDFVQKRILSRLSSRIEKSKQLWDDALFNALRRPLSLLIWLLGISFAADIVGRQTETAIFEAVAPLRDVGVIVIIAWFFFRLITEVENNIVLAKGLEGKEIDRTTVDAIGKLLRLSVIITAVLVALQTLGISISGILAFGGVGGIAIGFAAKDLLANFFGGLMVYLDRPFAVGDWIRSPDRNIEGTWSV